MSLHGSRRAGAMTLAILALALLAFAQESPQETETAESPPPIHSDPDVVMQLLQECTRAAVLGDRDALYRALEGIDSSCRNIHDPVDERYSSRLREYDWAFHRTLATARDVAAKGDLDGAYEQYQWVTRGCWLCHVQAVHEGLYSLPGSSE